MSDIVKMLRQGEKEGVDGWWSTMAEAADEIELLRTKIAKADYLLNQGAPTLALEALQQETK